MNKLLQPFKVLILYDTLHAGTSAMATYQRLARKLADGYLFSVDLRRFDMLDLPSRTHWTSKQAANADMVIVAWDSSPDALNALKNWLTQWPEATGQVRRALVALYTGAAMEENSDGFDACIGAFHALAERSGMDLIPQNDELARGAFMQAVAESEASLASLLTETFVPAHGGLAGAADVASGVRRGINV
jgi:hypothetical protein